MNAGLFKKGEVRTFKKVCSFCNNEFLSNSGSRKKCADCCKCENCGNQLKDGTDRFCGKSCAGKWKFKNYETVRIVLSDGFYHPNRGRGISRYRKGLIRHDLRGDKNWNWKGGKGTIRHAEMQRVEYRIWRDSVYIRDDYTCLSCGKRGGKLNAHHIFPWAKFPELRYEISNGKTLCVDCHRKEHKK